MMNLLAELKRRQMFRVAAAYAVIAWILLQLVNNLTPALRLPDWAATFVVVLLIVGFPVALLFCWIQHLPSADGSAPSVKAGKLDWVLIGALGMVILLIGYQQITPSSDATTQQAGVVGARDASASPATAISLAVLPFTNLSGDASQEFFSDGITEEIIAALARIPDLRVVARGSATQFKGERRDLRAVGQALGATHLIEGSVRKAGTRVRITAQLVKADDGVTDLFGVMFKPFDFDAEKKYPIIEYVYPGPQTESVTKTFNPRELNVALANVGFIVIEVGNRGGNPQRSKWYHNYGYGNLRDYGLADKKTAIEQLAKRYPWIDLSRVGIYGHSGGGFMTAAAMFNYQIGRAHV